ncbi:MAG: hypothetical protein QOE10_528, partial [Gaiellales bacterium]|nr:hypothetical protein [Gaiellales bacterium]
PLQGLAAVLAVAALAAGGAVAAASTTGGGTGTVTTTTGTSTAPTAPPHPRAFPFARGLGGAYDFFDTATKTALQETFEAVQTAEKTGTTAGNAPDDIRDAAVAAARTRLEQAVTDGALTKAQGAAVLAALTTQLGARAAVIDAAAAVLKLTPADLAKQLAAGTRLDAIAATQGVNLQDVFSAIQKAAQAQGAGGLGFGLGFGFGARGGVPGMGGPPGMGGRFGHGGFGGHRFKHNGAVPPPPTPTQPANP